MKIIYYCLIQLILINAHFAKSQNLISNGDFEIADTCPDDMYQLQRCHNWYIGNLSPDYFNCNFYGNMVTTFPHGGTGYVHMISGYMGTPVVTDTHNEMIKTKLLHPLKAGKRYKVIFDVGLDFYSVPTNRMDFGFYFYNESSSPGYAINYYSCMGIQPQVKISCMSLTTNEYTHFEICFTADKEMDSLLLGAFCTPTTLSGPPEFFNFMFDDLSVVEVPSANIYSDRSSVCAGDSVVFKTDTTAINATWIFSGGIPSAFNGIQPPPISYPVAGIYDVIIISPDECNGFDTVVFKDYIEVHGLEMIDLIPDTAIKCYEKNLILSSNTNLPVTWNTGSTSSSIEINLPGMYYCSAEALCNSIHDSCYVREEFCPCSIYIPNAFTPDNDGVNDIFRVYGESPSFDLHIFNRWGELVFRSEKLSDTWDGCYLNKKVQEGVFIYKAVYKDCKNNDAVLTGTITVVY